MTGGRRRLLLLAVGVAVAVTMPACRTDVLVRVAVEEDGTGTVEVGVGLDDEALSHIPDLAQQLRVEDLEQAGWAVSGPAAEDDGRTWVRAVKPFASPEAASAVVAEVTGADGPLRGFTVTRERSLARTELTVDGTVDLSGGLEAFSDAEVAAALDGLPLGQELPELLGGTPPAEAVRVTVAVGLPGEVEADATEEAPGIALWEVPLGEGPVEVRASSSELRTATVAWLVVAAAAALLLAGVLVARWSGAGRYRRRW